MAARKEIPREISIYINDVAVVNSMAGINREITKTNNEIKNLNKNSATYDADLKRHKETLSGLKEKQTEFKEEINDTNVSTSKAKEAFSKMFTGLASGDLATAKEGFEEIKGSIGGMVKSALAFIATPLGAAIAVVSGIAIGTKAIFDFNEGLQKSNNLLMAFGLSGAEMSKVRSEIGATAETFDKDFEEIASKANSLSKTYGISMSEANAEIARGLADGGAQNSEFLDSLGEYDEFFARAGYSARDFINIINTGPDYGIYSDKLPDALKEADLSLKEQTKATRDALTNAFGASFTDEILAKVTTGEITTKTALEKIAVKAKETGLTQQQQAQLTADVFKGAGEDAGGALKILEVVGAASKRELSESAKASLVLVAANEKLNKAQSDLFEIDGFGTIWTNIKASAIDALGSMLEYIVDVKKDIQPLIDFVGVVFVNAWNVLKTNIAVAFDVIGGALKYFFTYISTIFNFVIKLFQGDFAGALDVLKNGFIKLGNIVGDTFAKIKNHVIDGLKAIINNVAPFLDAIGIDVDKIQKKLDSFKSKEVVLKTSSESGKTTNNPEAVNTKATAEELAKQKAIRDAARQKEIDANQKLLDKKKAAQEKHDKELWDKAIALAKAKTDLAKTELDYFISNNRSKIDNTKQLTPEIIAEETKRLDEIKSKQNQALDDKIVNDKKALDNNSKQELAELKKLLTDKIISKSEFNQLEIQNKNILTDGLKSIDLEYETAKQNLEFQFSESTTSLKKEYIEQQKQLEIEQLQAQNELDILEADSKLQADRVKQAQDYKIQLAGYKKLFDDKKITQIQYDRFLAASKKEQEALDRVAKLQQLNGTLGGLNQIAGALGDMFGQSKALSIAQAGINGAMAVTSILAQYPKYDGGFAMWASIAAAGITTIAQVGKIASTKAPATPKFFYGGFNNSNGAGGSTGTTAHLGTDEFGKITGVTHDEEWVAPKIMTQSPKYAATFSWLESERKGILGNKHFNGGETSTGTVAPFVTTPTQNTDALLMAINRLNDHLDKGIKAEANIGYKQAKEIKTLNDEIEMSNQYGIVNK